MNHLAASVLGLLCVCGAALPAGASDQTVAPTTDRLTAAARLSIPTSSGVRTFLIDTPDAPSSGASRDDTRETDHKGRSLGFTPGYKLTSRVIIRAANPQAAAKAVGASAKLSPADAKAAPNTQLTNFFYADTNSIRAAATLAARLQRAPGIELAYLDLEWPKTLRNTIPTDPLVPQQWHLINAANSLADTNADGAWKQGFTGAGVTVGILEGGWDATHEDLAANFHEAASQPNIGFSDHGTSSAGLVAAVANNGRGVAGVAHGARISKLFYGTIAQIAEAFGFANSLNHIKSNSWGPFDNGRIASIDPLELAAIESAALTGRNGKGVVIIWAGGNGGITNNDRVDYDPYASNRFSIAVGAIDNIDRKALYSEPGSSLMLVTTSDYDLPTFSDVGIVTTAGIITPEDTGYTTNFGGTSAAAPIAAGAAALVLSANSNLTARDVQHVLIRSARTVNPLDPSWAFNGSGAGNARRFSEQFGFGAIDAGAATSLATTWVNRPPQSSVIVPPVTLNVLIPDANPTGVASSVQVTGTMLVERVQVTLTAAHAAIGNLRITLTSPSGTQALLANTRVDSTAGGYANFTFSPVKFWEERSAGAWTLRVADLTAGATGTLNSWQLKLHGYQPACPCDWNVSGGGPGLQDVFDYLTSFFAGNGDFNGNGAATLQDLFDFLDCWFGGC